MALWVGIALLAAGSFGLGVLAMGVAVFGTSVWLGDPLPVEHEAPDLD